jgi:hypothetical protein
MMKGIFQILFLFITILNLLAADRTSRDLVGCYEVTSLRWTPVADSKIKLIPNKFQLTDKFTGLGTKRFFDMHSLESDPIPQERLWSWSLAEETIRGKRVRLDFSTGFGGIKGIVRRARDGSLRGNIKEYCDSRCGWKRETGHLRARRIPCP